MVIQHLASPRGDRFFHIRWSHYRSCGSRWNHHKVLLWITFVSVLILLRRNLWSMTGIIEDHYVISHWIPKGPTAKEKNDTLFWNAYLAGLPPVPWPIDSDGCYAEMGTRPYCQFHHLLIDLNRVTSANLGGERLVTNHDDNNNDNNETTRTVVMGQGEDNEYLTYQPGAFQLFTDRNTTFQRNEKTFAYVNDVLNALQIVNVDHQEARQSIAWMNCTRYFPGTTLFLQRYEYVNLYHTVTDWWNTWTVYRYLRHTEVADLAVIFLDAHPHGNLDSVWETLFGKFVHLRRLNDEIEPSLQNLCFERAILVPPGYISHLWPEAPPMGGMGDNRAHEMMPDFVNFVLDKLNLTQVHKIPGHVVIIDRKPYVAHARSGATDDRSLNNLPDVAEALRQRIPNVTSVRLLPLHDMSFRDQVTAVREADVLVGVHGAGLTHLVFMDQDTHVVEFQMNLNFFVHLAECKFGQLTLHQIPFTSGSVPDFILNQHLLPTFAKIYGLNT